MADPIRPIAATAKRYDNPGGTIKGFMLGLNADGTIMYKPPLALQFQYNPSEMSDEKNTQWVVTDIPGLDRPMYAWSCGGERIIEFTLFLNAYEYGNADMTSLIPIPGLGGIRSELAKLDSFMYSAPKQYSNLGSGLVQGAVAGIGASSVLAYSSLFTGDGHNPLVQNTAPVQFTPPPKCIFGYGTDVLECVVKKVDKKIEMWDRNLDPIRARVHITLGVDENSPRAVASRSMRETLITLGLVNINPLASIPLLNGRVM
jgi:hypothetical protein